MRFSLITCVIFDILISCSSSELSALFNQIISWPVDHHVGHDWEKQYAIRYFHLWLDTLYWISVTSGAQSCCQHCSLFDFKILSEDIAKTLYKTVADNLDCHAFFTKTNSELIITHILNITEERTLPKSKWQNDGLKPCTDLPL